MNRIDVVVRRFPPAAPDTPTKRFSDHMTTVKVLIAKAYDLDTYRVLGLPDWAQPEGAQAGDYYDVDAIAPMEKPTRAELQEMLRSLLAERFQLRAHLETRELPVYALTVAKGGVKLKPVIGEPAPDAQTIFMFIQFQSRRVEHPIVDRTGLTGFYTFPSIPREVSADRSDSPSALSGLFAEYLGLELKPVRERTEALVVDHVERPSAN